MRSGSFFSKLMIETNMAYYKKQGVRRKKLVHVSAKMAAKAPALAAFWRKRNAARRAARKY